MRRPLELIAPVFFAFALSAAADKIVLKDGQVISTQGPYKTRGSQAIVKRSDGTLISIPLSEIDREKSAVATAKVSEPKTLPQVNPSNRMSAAEIARAKSPRKAGVVLTDQDVSHTVSGGGGEGGAKGDDDGRVEIGPTSETKTDTGVKITGSVQNTGKGEVSGVGVTIEAIGDENKTVNTIFATLAQDKLAPGEKASFSAEVPNTETPVKSFRFMPRWKYIPKASAAPAGTGEPGATPAAAPPAEATPKPAAAPKPAATAPPRADIAPPSANAPVGAPSQPGQSYLPPPSGEQAKPPQ